MAVADDRVTARRFEGRSALITGGGTGLGRVTALRLAREGACVTVLGRRQEQLDESCQAISAAGGQSLAVQGDVSEADDCARAITEVVDRFGSLDVLVNCAGIHGGISTVADLDEGVWDQVVDTNLKGSHLASKFALPEMRRSGGGSIVMVSSIWGVRGSRWAAAYQSSKGGLVTLTRHMAVAHAAENVRVNCVCPGVYESPTTQAWLADRRTRADVDRWHPMERIGDVTEVSAAVAFLASDEASFITGAVLPVDGGYLAAGRGPG